MASCSTNSFPNAVVAFVALTWMGLLLGVSFLATPVKFQASSLDLAVALDVGRVTFAAFSTVELGLSLLLGIAALFARPRRLEMPLAAIAIIIVAIQTLWLLPVLDARIEAVIAGQPMPPSLHHKLYAVMEVGKAGALAVLGTVALFRLGWRGAPEAMQG